MSDKLSRKVVLIGTGFVGMSYAYSLLNQGAAVDELVLIDINKEKAEGEAMDLNHGLPFSPKKMKIYAGEYSDCKDAAIVCISAGANQLPGETRLDLIAKNRKVFESVVGSVMESGFDGIFLVATNPVDIMSYITWQISGLDPRRVIGSGTTLDTARLRFALSEKINVDPRNCHGYVMGEHGDSEFIPWSFVTVGVKPIKNVMESLGISESDLEEIAHNVKHAAYDIINRKKATYYGIGMSLTRITNAILNDENSILTLSSYLDGEYGHNDVYIGVPSIVNRSGIRRVVELNLNDEEKERFANSVEVLKEAVKK